MSSQVQKTTNISYFDTPDSDPENEEEENNLFKKIYAVNKLHSNKVSSLNKKKEKSFSFSAIYDDIADFDDLRAGRNIMSRSEKVDAGAIVSGMAGSTVAK